jgi:hypothetical protein
MRLNNDQKQLLATVVKTVNKGSELGYWEEQLVMSDGTILTLTAKSPALMEGIDIDKETKQKS